MRGFLVIDKPEGISSHHVIAIFRALLGKVKIGHTGTLDPFATGVLVLAFGTCTRLISFLPEEEKGYRATLKLGQKTQTGDTEGTVIETKDVGDYSKEYICSILKNMEGEQQQVPPQFSALKHKGKPLYSYARKGQHIDVPSRKIHVYSLALLSMSADILELDSVVSRGTYVRQLGVDIAEKMGTVGHLVGLRRTMSGCFSIEKALSLEEVSLYTTGLTDWKQTLSKEGKSRFARCSAQELWTKLQRHLYRVEDVFSHLKTVEISEERKKKIENGLPPLRIPGVEVQEHYWYTYQGTCVALAQHDGEKVSLLRVFN